MRKSGKSRSVAKSRLCGLTKVTLLGHSTRTWAIKGHLSKKEKATAKMRKAHASKRRLDKAFVDMDMNQA